MRDNYCADGDERAQKAHRHVQKVTHARAYGNPNVLSLRFLFRAGK
jgi:hypothetical protein